MSKIAFYTLGCRANQYQTEALRSEFGARGSEFVDFKEQANIYIINTCTVTIDADRKSRQAIRRALRQNPRAKVVVTGCYARLEESGLKKLSPNIEIASTDYRLQTTKLSPRIRANLMIQDGCEHFCSYCLVPFARGKVKSKSLEQINKEARRLVKAGAREIVLTGINLGAYEFGLARAIKRLLPIDDLLRLRLSSVEPLYLKSELVETMAKNSKVCRYLHVPLQSGDNRILKEMNRNYSREDYLDLINQVRGKMPDCGLTTDIIVGFPGEGETEFKNTVDLVKRIKFSRIHVFSYSKRKGTPAANFPDQVDPETKNQRNKVLRQLRDKYMTEFARQYLNQEVEILVEQPGQGLTANFIRCFFPDPADSSGSLRKIFARSVTKPGEIRA